MSAYRSSQPSIRSFAPPVDLVRPRHDSKERPRVRPQLIRPAEALDAEVEAALDPVRRAVNVIIASVALVVALPIMALVALAIKLTSKGPVFYTQVRVGLDRRQSGRHATNHRRESDIGGRPFDIIKFRTMYVDAEDRTGAVWATRNDPRVTPVGRILRASRLDELPQLVNVIRGEMNIVGPRPERPTIFAELRENINEYPLRQRAKPGITGLAQINQHYDSCLEDVRRKVQYDLEYIQRQGVLEDIRIMLKTVPVILFRKGGW
jgi:lipopolysaccharide/colanic/teichoic acid biosynthesis glycosyltransferase